MGGLLTLPTLRVNSVVFRSGMMGDCFTLAVDSRCSAREIYALANRTFSFSRVGIAISWDAQQSHPWVWIQPNSPDMEMSLYQVLRAHGHRWEQGHTLDVMYFDS